MYLFKGENHGISSSSWSCSSSRQSPSQRPSYQDWLSHLMKCNFPRYFNKILCPCGLCMACRINKRREWTHRILLESFLHPSSLFVTLTYSEENLPHELQKRDLQLFLKRLRKSLNKKIRYYAVGEYGEKTFRPHFHLIIFNMTFDETHLIDAAWQKGFIKVGDVTPQSIGYTAGYVVKKMTKVGDERLQGRCPEFSLMSRNPGIGCQSMDVIWENIKEHIGTDFVEANKFLPRVLRHGSKLFPLGRYLRNKLLEHYDYSYEFKEFNYEIESEKVRNLFNDFKNSEETKEALNDPRRKTFFRSLRWAFERSRADIQSDTNLKNRDKLFRSQNRVI